MNALKNHAEKLVLALVALLCAAFAWWEYDSAETEPSELVAVDASREKIESVIKRGVVTEKYTFGSEAAGKIKHKETLDANLDRAKKPPEGSIPAFTAFLQPERPNVDQAERPPDIGEMTQRVFAELGKLEDVKADPDHGRVFVTFLAPAPGTMKYMEGVRVEIYRGEGADGKVDTSTPYASIDLGPEEVEAPATAPKEAEPAEKPAEEQPVRRRRPAAEEKKPAAPKAKDAKKEEIPAEIAERKVFSDTHVEPKEKYSYQLRLIARMTVKPNAAIEKRDAAGAVTQVLVVSPPKGAQTVQPSKAGGAMLYATPLANVVSATPPSNFEIRLAGTSGKLDPPGTPDFKRTKDYKGTFAIHLWVTDAQAWHDKMIEAGPEERLKGSIMYKSADTGKNTTYDFDSNYKLIEIKWGELVKEKEVDEAELDKDGNPVVDKSTGRPKMVKRKVKGDPIPIEVAVLEDVTTKERVEKMKGGDAGLRKSSIDYYRRLAEEQAKQQKIFMQQMEKVRARVKAADEERKAKQAAEQAAADAEAQRAAQPQIIQQPGGGGRSPGGGGRNNP